MMTVAQYGFHINTHKIWNLLVAKRSHNSCICLQQLDLQGSQSCCPLLLKPSCDRIFSRNIFDGLKSIFYFWQLFSLVTFDKLDILHPSYVANCTETVSKLLKQLKRPLMANVIILAVTFSLFLNPTCFSTFLWKLKHVYYFSALLDHSIYVFFNI